MKRRRKFFGIVTVRLRPQFVFRQSLKFNARTFQKFLGQALDRLGKICLVMDNVRYHFAKRLRPFLRANRGRLWLYRLPPYSPELNAVEMVWRETRKAATHNRYFRTGKGLSRAVQSQFRVFQRNPGLLAGTVAQFLRA